MGKKKTDEPKAKYYVPQINSFGAIPHYEVKMRAVMGKTRKKVYTNANGNDYRLANVDMVLPNGDIEPTQASIWLSSLDNAEIADQFKKGNKIALMVQIGGDYDGFAKVQLAGGSINTASPEFIKMVGGQEKYDEMMAQAQDWAGSTDEPKPTKKKKSKKGKTPTEAI